MKHKYSRSKKNKNNKNSKNNKSKSPKSSRVKKIIQGGGYYKNIDNHTNDINQHIGGSNNQTTFNINNNTLFIIIVILLVIIGVLVYLNIIQTNKQKTIILNDTINDELLKEAEHLKKYKNNNSKNNSRNNNISKDNDLNDKEEDFHGVLSGNSQYNLGHRLVGINADNPHIIPIMPKILNHNMERIINPLLPPERSYVNTYGIPTNIPSRGFSGGYQQVGSLHKTEVANDDSKPGNNNKSVILPLFGQPTYPGSNKWNYYTTTDKNAMVKMTFKVNNKDSDDKYGVTELMSGDQVSMPEYNGKFDVKVYQFDQPRYIPYIY
jgi:hypothetical protein